MSLNPEETYQFKKNYLKPHLFISSYQNNLAEFNSENDAS